MSETCPVCKTECSDGATACSICGFEDELGINRTFPIPEDTKHWLETVVKPYRVRWEARKREAELLTQLETAKKRESELLAQLETAKSNAIIQPSSASTVFIDPRDGKVYRTVKIASQVWMAENLNYDTEGSKCYNNDPKNAEKYGRLYDWETAKKAAPPGWHLPSNYEWEILVDFVGGSSTAGKHLKTASGWKKHLFFINGNGSDEYDFSALPGGYGNSGGDFYSVGDYGYWWSSSERSSNYAYNRLMYYNDENAIWGNYAKSSLFSVRCVQD